MLVHERFKNTLRYKNGQIWRANVAFSDILDDNDITEKQRTVLVYGSDDIVTSDIPCLIITTNCDTPGIKIMTDDVFDVVTHKQRVVNILCNKIIYLKPKSLLQYCSALPDDIMNKVSILRKVYDGNIRVEDSPLWAQIIIKKGFWNNNGGRTDLVERQYEEALRHNNVSRFKWAGDDIPHDYFDIEAIEMSVEHSKKYEKERMVIPNANSICTDVMEHVKPTQKKMSKSTKPVIENLPDIWPIPDMDNILLFEKNKLYTSYLREEIRFIMNEPHMKVLRWVYRRSRPQIYRLRIKANDEYTKDYSLKKRIPIRCPEEPIVINNIGALSSDQLRILLILSYSPDVFDKFFKIEYANLANSSLKPADFIKTTLRNMLIKDVNLLAGID